MIDGFAHGSQPLLCQGIQSKLPMRGQRRSVMRRCGSAIIAGALMLVAACGGADGPSVPDGPYRAQIIQAQQEATSDFQRQVLSDGKITKAEYDEAVHRYVKCFTDQGVDVTAYDNGGGYYQYGVPSDENGKFQQLSDSCAKGTVALIEDLYIQMLTNPSGGDIDDAVAACLIRKHLVDNTFTGAELKQLQAADPRGKNLPYDQNDPDAMACETNPQQ